MLPKPELQGQLTKIKERITHYTGLKIEARSEDKLLEAIQLRMAILSLDFMLYAQKLLVPSVEGNKEILELVSHLVNPETYFFRDKGQMALLRDYILPKIIEKRRSNQTLRIWSAACSTGEEAYSIAMMVMLLIPNWKDWKIIIVGTDINNRVLEHARKGTFSSSSFRSFDKNFFSIFFQPLQHNQWTIDSRVSGLVNFYQQNLVADSYPNSALQLYDMDLILCRNVFIYFYQPLIVRVVNKIVDTLCPGGILMTGHGELHGVHHPLLKEVFCRESVVYQKKTLKEDQPLLPNLSYI